MRTEIDWETFFKANQWIFGLGLRFRFLTVFETRQTTAARALTVLAKKASFSCTPRREERFTVLVEIKKPQTKFFQNAVNLP